MSKCECCGKNLPPFSKKIKIGDCYVCSSCSILYFPKIIGGEETAKDTINKIDNLLNTKRTSISNSFVSELAESKIKTEKWLRDYYEERRQSEEKQRKEIERLNEENRRFVEVRRQEEAKRQEERKKEKDLLFEELFKTRNDSKMRKLLSIYGLSSDAIEEYFDILSKEFTFANAQDSSLDNFMSFIYDRNRVLRITFRLNPDPRPNFIESHMEIKKLADDVINKSQDIANSWLKELQQQIDDAKEKTVIPEIKYDKNYYGSWFYVTIPIVKDISNRISKIDFGIYSVFDDMYVEYDSETKKYYCNPSHTITGFSSSVSFTRNDGAETRFKKIQKKVIEIDILERNRQLKKQNEEMSLVLQNCLKINEVINEKELDTPTRIEPNNIEAIINELNFKGSISINFQEKSLNEIKEQIQDYCREALEGAKRLKEIVFFLAKDNRRIELLNQEIASEYQEKLRYFQLRKAILSTSYFKDKDKTKQSVEDYVSKILLGSEYPTHFEKSVLVEYDAEKGRCIIEYQLPTENNIPTIEEYKYNAVENKPDAIKEKQADISKKWTKYAHSICLRSINEVFNNTVEVKEVIFNGWLKGRNKSTGKEQNNCILSIQTSRNNIMDLEIENVDGVSWFKTFKGVSAAVLSDCVPIQPIQTTNKADKRFIVAHGVADSINEGTNLAAMDWQEFEHLIRELFEKEYGSSGSEVKITQSSRDGGVDAVIFDNDPIRGGKIIIQAKRYTNTVGVSAVRDLYGTIMNEGAMKGILVTTSDFGSDSYAFAKDKPITLLSGGHLIWLLNKHGYHARIDLEEAKKLNEGQPER